MWFTVTLLVIQVFGSSCQNIIPQFPITYPNSSNDVCRRDSLLLEKGIQEQVLWAMKMWDSSVKSGVGIVTGTLFQYGNFDECLSVTDPIIAKYCALTVELHVPSFYNSTDPFAIDYKPEVSIWEKIKDRGVVSKQKTNVVNWAICVPSSCAENDIINSLNEYLQEQNISGSITVSLLQGACSKTGDNKFSLEDLLFCSTIGLFVIIVILSTIYDMKNFEVIEDKPTNILLCFSLRRSLRSLVKPNPPVNGYDLNIINIFHLMPIIIVVFGHRFGMFQIGGMSNYYFVEKVFKYPVFSMWAGYIGLIVDCFFVISGFMVGVLLPYYYENYKPSFLTVVLNRFIRLVPSVLVVSLFYATVYNKIGDGPLWNSVISREKKYCVENWWTNFLFIGNYINTERSCVLQTWYIHCDFQLYLLLVIIFFIGKTHSAYIKSLIIVLIGLCTFLCFYTTYTWRLTAYNLFYKRMWENVRTDPYFRDYYIKTQFRATPYLIGFLAGYIFHLRSPKKLSKSETNSFLLGGFLIMLMTYCSGYLFSDPENHHLGFSSALYASLTKFTWAIGFLMVILSFLIGTSDSVLTKLFSLKIFIPLGKLSYHVYLVHMVFQVYSAASRRTSSFITINEWISSTISDLVYSFLAGLFLNTIIESPCRYLFKYLTFKQKTTKPDVPV